MGGEARGEGHRVLPYLIWTDIPYTINNKWPLYRPYITQSATGPMTYMIHAQWRACHRIQHTEAASKALTLARKHN